MLLDDLRYSIRSLSRQRALSLAAVVTLSLGIGACTAVFAVLDAVLLRPLPYPDAAELVDVYRFEAPGVAYAPVATADFLDVQADLDGLAEVAGDVPTTFTIGGSDGAERVLGAYVTDAFFDVLGLAPQRGRWLDAVDQSGETNGIVISDRLWRRKFAAREDALGATLIVAGEPRTIVGIAPAALDYPADHDVWVPLRLTELPRQRGSNFVQMIARVDDGATGTVVQERLSALAQRLAASFPQEHTGLSLRIASFQDRLVAGVRGSLWMLMIAVSLVLVVVCANVANLLLTRMLERERELATRAALGASRYRLVREALVDALVLAAAGAAGGLAVALGGIDVLVALEPRGLPRLSSIEIGASAWIFAAAATLAASAACGILPAFRARREDLRSVMSGARARHGRGSPTLGKSLVVAQLALSMTLVVAVGLLLATLDRLHAVDPGFDTRNLLTAMVALPAPMPLPGDAEAERSQIARNSAFLGDLEERLEALPGAVAVGVIDSLPLSGTNNFNGSVGVPGRDFAPGSKPVVEIRWISAGYFRTAGIPLLAGEDFPVEGDAAGSVVVNESVAERLWPGEPAVGRAIEVFESELVVRGVVGDVRQWSLDRNPSPELYLSYGSTAAPSTAGIVVRTAVEPASLAEALRRVVAETDPSVAVYEVRTTDDMSRAGNARRAFALTLLGAFALASASIAAIGLYAVMSHAVARQKREIGIRIALGAPRSRVLGEHLRAGVVLASAGIGVGSVCALAFSRLLRGLVVGVEGSAAAIYAATAIALLLIALAASVGPAWRASGIAPMAALREE